MAASPLRVIFAGTPAFAVPSLEALLGAGHAVVAVYTQPDRPAGRGRRPRPSPVKEAALAAGLAVRQPRTLRDAAEQAALAALGADLMVVVAYGLLLPPPVLAAPRLGCVNVHASLLPRWRGAAPIQRAILAGDGETGVCLMQMDEGLDTGPVLARAATPIGPEETAGELHDRLAGMGARLLVEALPALARGELAPVPQDEAQATYAEKLAKEEAVLDFARPAEELARRVRAFNPWPVAEARLDDGTRLRVWRARALPGGGGEPGRVLAAGREGVDVATGRGVLRILELQRPGGRPLAAGDFVNALPLAGRRLGPAAGAAVG
ncbi:methionyl-tRNA formyltransferase [Inmirania thermothiophila]|uniref:Methionyl-tRNA formyltransferase n=1 Tax=Inmirania thermothiophila TaxID=1750597 RepID=A0A3N1Y9G0_9GAMM|nr:methionyl-tRNA formyltransferase [Inmirania thermothiophila]ROR34252.1 methionyl-tRNA formyltransferase [Inmirania thermothiophila]